MKRGIKDKPVKTCVHLSRAVARAVRDHEHCAMISIRDPDSQPVDFQCKYADLLELEFHDVSEAVNINLWSMASHDQHERRWVVPGPAHAKAIADFIRRNWDRHIIVHCEAGISRSAAVCEALVRLGWGYKTYTSFGTSQANPLLLRMLVAEFGLVPVQLGDGELWERRK